MTNDRRTFKLGQRQELLEEIGKLELSIDAIVQALEDEFRMKSRDLSYIRDMNEEKVKTFGNDIARMKKKHKQLIEKLKDVNRELGIEED